MFKRIRNLSLFGIITLTLALSVLFGYFLQVQAVSMAYPIRNDVHSAQAENNRTDEDIIWQDYVVTTQDSLQIDGWYALQEDNNEYVIIFVHGIGGTRLNLLDHALTMYNAGYNIVMFDLRNHGNSEGEVTTMGETERYDVLAVVDFVENELEFTRENIVIYGQSLGGATTILAAADLPNLAGVVIETSYTDVQGFNQ